MRRPFILSCIAVIALAALNLWMWRELEAERIRSAELRTQLRQAAFPGSAPAQAARIVVAEARHPAARAVAAKPDASNAVPPSAQDWNARERQLLSDPNYREARKAELRMGWARLRQEGIRVLGASTADADAVIDWLVEKQLAESSRPNPRTAEQIAQRKREIQEAESRDDAELRELLGDAKAEQWERFMASQASRIEVAQLRVQLSATPEPMREAQVEPLVAALQPERKRFADEMQAYRDAHGGDGELGAHGGELYLQQEIERTAAANERAHAAVTPILTPAQLAKFDELNARRLETLRVQLRISVARADARQRSNP